MELSTREREVLRRYREKCRAAGGPRVGYVLRLEAIVRGVAEEADEALRGLVAKGLLAANETEDLFFLTETGAAAVAEI